VQSQSGDDRRALDAANPQFAAQLCELDALYLFGTLGFDAVMRVQACGQQRSVSSA